jgi:hypothetical protein
MERKAVRRPVVVIDLLTFEDREDPRVAAIDSAIFLEKSSSQRSIIALLSCCIALQFLVFPHLVPRRILDLLTGLTQRQPLTLVFTPETKKPPRDAARSSKRGPPKSQEENGSQNERLY